MIITKEQFDEFVESAENQNILWTDTLALIGVTVGDVPDVDVIEAQAAEIARLTNWHPIETAPDDDWFLAAIKVRHKNGGYWWEYHVIWLDDETGDIHTDCEQGWSLSDYSHWIALPDAPHPLSAALAQETQP